MSSASPVSVCSNALQRLGSKAISDFEEGTEFSGLAANLWPAVRDALLRAHPWNCATRRVVLSPMVDKPAFDYSHQFQLPGDWLKTLQVGRRGCPLTYQQEGRRILCCANALPLVYIFRNENVSSWDDALVLAAELKMAAAMAYSVTSSTSLRDSFNQEGEVMLKRAKADDGQDSQPEEFSESDLLTSRY